jgi:hypothetical protein
MEKKHEGYFADIVEVDCMMQRCASIQLGYSLSPVVLCVPCQRHLQGIQELCILMSFLQAGSEAHFSKATFVQKQLYFSYIQ